MKYSKEDIIGGRIMYYGNMYEITKPKGVSIDFSLKRPGGKRGLNCRYYDINTFHSWINEYNWEFIPPIKQPNYEIF